MRDYISREDAIMVAGDMLNSLTGISCKDGENTAREYFRSIPSTDIRENVKAYWNNINDKYYSCSYCGGCADIAYHYCPWCGADMRGAE